MSDYTNPQTNQSSRKTKIKVRWWTVTGVLRKFEDACFCDMPCVNACPTEDRRYRFSIGQIKFRKSHRLLQNNLWIKLFWYACGDTSTDALVKGACVYNLQEVKPIEIGRQQSFATSDRRSVEEQNFCIPRKTERKKVGYSRQGPAGVPAHARLRWKIYEADIFEAKKTFRTDSSRCRALQNYEWWSIEWNGLSSETVSTIVGVPKKFAGLNWGKITFNCKLLSPTTKMKWWDWFWKLSEVLMKDNRYSVSQVRSLVVGDQKVPFIISVFVMVQATFGNTNNGGKSCW